MEASADSRQLVGSGRVTFPNTGACAWVGDRHQKARDRRRVRETSGVPSETHYARSGDIHIAYQVVGEGPIDLVYIPAGMQHVEHIWDSPPHARFYVRLASMSRLLLFDKRGTGMSDRIVGTPTLE